MEIEIFESIPFTAGGTKQNLEVTVLLALWYLGMLVAQ